MTASVIEQILAQVKTALTGATAAGAHVERAREVAFAPEELPALNIRRSPNDNEALGDNGQRAYVRWSIEHQVAGAAVETAADALHMEVHAVLCADAVLQSLGRGLRCTGTELETDAADTARAKLVAHYQMQVFVRPGNLTRAVN